jgi:hypothetical protein
MGDMRLSGVMPSGHTENLMPQQMSFIEDSKAVLDGVDLGRPAHRGGTWLALAGVRAVW